MRSFFLLPVVVVACSVAFIAVDPTGGVARAETAPPPSAVDLGVADSFAVFGGISVTNTGTSVINGNLGLGPAADLTGLTGASITGAVAQNDELAMHAHADLSTAFASLADLSPTLGGLGELSGLSLAPGVYQGTALTVNGHMVLEGSEDSVWVFQSTATLITASGSEISLVGGARAANIFWQVGTSATLGTGSTFVGTVIADQSIAATTGVSVDGRLFTVRAAVTLDGNTVSVPGDEEMPVDELPTGDVPADDVPADVAPEGDVPADVVPEGDVPSGSVPPAGDPIAAEAIPVLVETDAVVPVEHVEVVGPVVRESPSALVVPGMPGSVAGNSSATGVPASELAMTGVDPTAGKSLATILLLAGMMLIVLSRSRRRARSGGRAYGA